MTYAYVLSYQKETDVLADIELSQIRSYGKGVWAVMRHGVKEAHKAHNLEEAVQFCLSQSVINGGHE